MKRFRISKRAMLRFLPAALSLAYCLYVYAHSTGMTDRTRKSASPGCTCHGVDPTLSVSVTISGPDTLTVNETGFYDVTITGGPAVRGGTDIAASDGTLNPVDAALQKLGDELTHVAPKPFASGSVTFNFQYAAPAGAARETLFANGNSVNFNDSNSGDSWNFAPNKPIVVQSVTLASPNGGESWTAGSSQNIAWTSGFVAAVRIEYSTNGGGSWSEIVASTPAAAGIFPWTVPATATAQAFVRVTDASRPATVDVGDAPFTIELLPPTLQVTDPNGGESWVAGSVHAITWSPTSVSEVRIEYSTDAGASWALAADSVAAGGGSYPWTLPLATTVSALVRLRDVSDLGVGDSSDAVFSILTGQTVPVKLGWNMVSVPLTVSDAGKSTLFPTASSSAFAYQGGYAPAETLRNGIAYWLKFPSDAEIDVAGVTRLADSVAVRAGWNMVGSVSSPVPVSGIAADPPGILQSQFFGYGGSYTVADSILPGRGYWVKASEDGILTLAAAPAMERAGAFAALLSTEMPPPPPGAAAAQSRSVPNGFALEQNYPNPFNPSTVIRYQLPAAAVVRLQVFNALGEEVATLVDEAQDAGVQSVNWNGRSAAGAELGTGIYFYRIRAGEFLDVKTMLYLK